MDVSLEQQNVVVRRLRPDDLNAVIGVDRKITGRKREEYFKIKLDQALSHTGVEASLAAEVDGHLVGFLLCWVYFGEFGVAEPVAALDTFGVHPDFVHQGVARAMLEQLRTNLLGLGIAKLRTEVDWEDQSLLSFFQHAGFRPAPRICLDWELEYSNR